MTDQKKDDDQSNKPAHTNERIAKFIARAGIASRRQAEAMIEEGRVTLNGARIDTAAINVSPSDKVAVDGKIVSKPPLRLWLFHKPRGFVTTAHDEKGRKTIYDSLPSVMKEMRTVGRLDLNSEGLLLLTNDGDLKRALELPSTGWRRKYRVRGFGRGNEKRLEELRAGAMIEGTQYRPMDIRFDREQGDNSWYTVQLREGKNREIRRAFEYMGLQVNRLIRTSYGPFQLGAMEKSELSEMRPKALRTLLGGLLPRDAVLGEMPMDLSEPEIETPTPHKGQSSADARKYAEKDAARERKKGGRPDRDDRGRTGGRGDSRDGDKPRRDFKGKDFKGKDDRQKRDFKRGDSKSRDDRPRDDRPRRDGDKPRRDFKSRDDRPREDRPRRDGEKPRFDRKPSGDRPNRSDERSDRPRRDGDRPDRPRRNDDRDSRRDSKPRGGNSGGDRGGRSFDRDGGGKPSGHPGGGRPSGGRPQSNRPSGNRGGARPQGGRPASNRGNRDR